MVEKTEYEVFQNSLFFLDSFLMRLRVFHFLPPYTCSVFLNSKLYTILGSLVVLYTFVPFTCIKPYNKLILIQFNSNFYSNIFEHILKGLNPGYPLSKTYSVKKIYSYNNFILRQNDVRVFVRLFARACVQGMRACVHA
jgi:hypothetical protein